MDHLVKEYEKIVKKQKQIDKSTQQSLDSLILLIKQTKSKIQSDYPSPTTSSSTTASNQRLSQSPTEFPNDDIKSQIKMIQQQIKQTYTNISESHKEFVSQSVGKYSKNMEKKFKIDLESIWDPNALDDLEPIINDCIGYHFIREGQFNIYDTFVAEIKDQKMNNIPAEMEKGSNKSSNMIQIQSAPVVFAQPIPKELSSVSSVTTSSGQKFRFGFMDDEDNENDENKHAYNNGIGGHQMKSQFIEMFKILQELKQEKVENALDWARKNKSNLEKVHLSNSTSSNSNGGALEFTLIKLQFLKLLGSYSKCVKVDDGTKGNGQLSRILEFAKTEFPSFSQNKIHLKEIQRLMCSVLFMKRPTKSPYKDFTSKSLWMEARSQFTQSFCQILGRSSESPLYTTVTIGTNALPVIIKMSSILKDQSVEWSQKGELPVEIPLQDNQRYHSVFSCPVSKEQGTDENPPMMMGCGHVVCKESLFRLNRGNPAQKFKCPYCPGEGTANMAVRIYF